MVLSYVGICRHWCTVSIWCRQWHPANEDHGIRHVSDCD